MVILSFMTASLGENWVDSLLQGASPAHWGESAGNRGENSGFRVFTPGLAVNRRQKWHGFNGLGIIPLCKRNSGFFRDNSGFGLIRRPPLGAFAKRYYNDALSSIGRAG
jgi:hypothetical protein